MCIYISLRLRNASGDKFRTGGRSISYIEAICTAHLQNKSKHRHPTVKDMYDYMYVMLSLRRKSTYVIFHVGTNNVKFAEPRERGTENTKLLSGLQDNYFIVDFEIKPNSQGYRIPQ